MLLCDFILVAGLGEIYARLREFLAWKSALLKEFLPAVVDFLLRIEQLLGDLHFQLRLLHFRRQIGASADFVGGLSLIVCTLGVLRSGSEVLMFEHGE